MLLNILKCIGQNELIPDVKEQHLKDPMLEVERQKKSFLWVVLTVLPVTPTQNTCVCVCVHTENYVHAHTD